MLLGLFLVSVVFGASGGSTINDYLVDIRNATLISVRSTERSSHQLDLSGLGLRKINKTAFTDTSNIKILNLANNSISTLSGSVFSSLRNLEHLSLADNAIGVFHGAFGGLENLKTLNISNNPFTVLRPGAFNGLNRTIDIFVRGNSLGLIYTDVFNLDNSSRKLLTDEDKDGDKVEDEDKDGDKDEDEYEDDYELNYIDEAEDGDNDGDEDEDEDKDDDEDGEGNWRFKVCINQGKVRILERVWSTEVLQPGCRLLKDDEDVYMENLGIKDFERGWYRLPKNRYDTTIIFRGNDIVRITPEMLNDLPANVQKVDLSNNKIQRLEQGVIANTYIRFFELSDNLISEIEENSLAGMKFWQLILSGNRLQDTRFLATVPRSLNKLFLNKNQIVEFTNDPSVNFYQLQEVDLSDNRITIQRANSLGGLPYLLHLDLSRNRIQTLEPGCFRNLKAMRYLKLGSNKIGDLGAGLFENLSHLHYLDLSRNKLTRITEGFRDSLSRNLETLDLSRNEIGSLENGTFVNVPKGRLDLQNNRIASIAMGSFLVPELYGEDLTHEREDDSDILGPLFAGNLLAMQLAEAGGITLPTVPKGIGAVYLQGNPLRRLENGALSGLQRGRNNYISVARNSIELIQGGLFDVGTSI